MYEYLEGRVGERGAARLVLDVGGVGYELLVPLGADFGGPGAEARAWTHLAVREDAHVLYGFADRESRELFRLLLRAKGVGPGLALGVLSGLSRRELLEAIAGGDVGPLVRIKGLGRRRAEQILLDLGEKAAELLALDDAEQRGVLKPKAPAARQKPLLDDAVAALLSIGFNERDAKKSVDAAAAEVGADDLETLVRTALHK